MIEFILLTNYFLRMSKNFTFYHFTILRTKKSTKKKNNNKQSLKTIYKRYTKSLHLLKISPSDEVVNNILKHADL